MSAHRLAPAQFWRLSVWEWRRLAAIGPGAPSSTFTAQDLAALLAQYPDERHGQ